MKVELHLLFDHWLVCKLVCDSVHLLDRSLIAAIESVNDPNLIFSYRAQACECICIEQIDEEVRSLEEISKKKIKKEFETLNSMLMTKY
jgi:hypothetical protein